MSRPDIPSASPIVTLERDSAPQALCVHSVTEFLRAIRGQAEAAVRWVPASCHNWRWAGDLSQHRDFLRMQSQLFQRVAFCVSFSLLNYNNRKTLGEFFCFFCASFSMTETNLSSQNNLMLILDVRGCATGDWSQTCTLSYVLKAF